MAKYTVQHDFSSWENGPVGPWGAGDEVELDDDLAAWVLRSSPGVVKPVSAPSRPKATHPAESRPNA